MEQVWLVSALWIGPAPVVTLLSISFRVTSTFSEIVVGSVAQLITDVLIETKALVAKTDWIAFPAAVFLTTSAMLGLNSNATSQMKSSPLLATVSTIVPIAIASAYFMPNHLRAKLSRSESPAALVSAR